MTAEQFAYWMQGFAELNSAPPTAEQWQSIRDHLALVFTKVTPPVHFIPKHFPMGEPIKWADLPYVGPTGIPAADANKYTVTC